MPEEDSGRSSGGFSPNKFVLRRTFNLKVFYHYVDEDGHLAVVMGTIVDGTIYAIRPDHKWILAAIAAEIVFGKNRGKIIQVLREGDQAG